MIQWSIDMSEFYSFLQMIWSAIPSPIWSLLGVLAMFAVFSSFRDKFGGESH